METFPALNMLCMPCHVIVSSKTGPCEVEILNVL